MKLERLRVVDLSSFLPGPYLTLALADHGAEVIKVEPPGEGDPGRAIGQSDGDTSVLFRTLNRGKKSIVLDLKSAAGQTVLRALCRTADVFVESNRPGVMRRLGADYATLAALNPRLVYCSISAFGQTGPYRDRPAHDLAVEALAGSVGITLGRGRRAGDPRHRRRRHAQRAAGPLRRADGALPPRADRTRRLHRPRHARRRARRLPQPARPGLRRAPRPGAARGAHAAAARPSTASTVLWTAATSRSAARR